MTSPVVLFDLDGTVLTFEGQPPGPGRMALESAMRELYSFEDATAGLQVAGGTDRALVRSMLRRAGAPDNEDAIARVLVSYASHLRDVLALRRYRPLGDVARTIDVLRRRGRIVGVSTGNTRAGAELKLASAQLEHTFDLSRGGFGSDAELRSDIVRIAAARCGDAECRAVVVVGDTEHDVRAGKSVGARVVGIASDERSRVELSAAGADAIVSVWDDGLAQAVLG